MATASQVKSGIQKALNDIGKLLDQMVTSDTGDQLFDNAKQIRDRLVTVADGFITEMKSPQPDAAAVNSANTAVADIQAEIQKLSVKLNNRVTALERILGVELDEDGKTSFLEKGLIKAVEKHEEDLHGNGGVFERLEKLETGGADAKFASAQLDEEPTHAGFGNASVSKSNAKKSAEPKSNTRRVVTATSPRSNGSTSTGKKKGLQDESTVNLRKAAMTIGVGAVIGLILGLLFMVTNLPIVGPMYGLMLGAFLGALFSAFTVFSTPDQSNH